jgi:mediator of RNA polymerase II transcription subunit 12
MSVCNLAQAGFLSRLADEYLNPIMTSRALARPFVDACLNKLTEVISHNLGIKLDHHHVSQIHNTAQDYLVDTEKQLRVVLQVCLPHLTSTDLTNAF